LATQSKVALRQKVFKRLMGTGGKVGIISAYGPFSKSVNKQRHGQLVADLQKLGYRKVHDFKGQWEAGDGSMKAEKSLLIPNIKYQHLFDLGEKYEQDAVIYKAGGVVGMYYRAGYAEVAVDPGTVDLSMEMADDKKLFSKSRNWSFSLGFLWGQHLPWNGTKPLSLNQVEKWIASQA